MRKTSSVFCASQLEKKQKLWGHLLGHFAGPWQCGMQDSMKTSTLIFLLYAEQLRKNGRFLLPAHLSNLLRTWVHFHVHSTGTNLGSRPDVMPHHMVARSSRHCAKSEIPLGWPSNFQTDKTRSGSYSWWPYDDRWTTWNIEDIVDLGGQPITK